jgi:hypothetical protein
LSGWEARKAISLLSSAESEYRSSGAVHYRLLRLYRSASEMPKAVAEAKWFKSQPMIGIVAKCEANGSRATV